MSVRQCVHVPADALALAVGGAKLHLRTVAWPRGIARTPAGGRLLSSRDASSGYLSWPCHRLARKTNKEVFVSCNRQITDSNVVLLVRNRNKEEMEAFVESSSGVA